MTLFEGIERPSGVPTKHGVDMLALPTLLLAVLPQANAADVERSITTRPTRLIWPAVDLRYEQKMGDKLSLFGETTLGRYNPLLVRIVSGLADAGGAEFKMNTYGVGAGTNYYFKSFDRGWYGGGSLGYDYGTYELSSSGESAEGKYQTLTVAPHIGYKRVTEAGFTFAWELGAGYGIVFGNEATSGNTTAESPASSGLAWTGGLFLGWSF